MKLPNRLTSLLSQKEAHFTFVGISLLLLNWPLVSVCCSGDVLTRVLRLFIVWCIIIVGLLLVSVSCGNTPPDDSDTDRKGRSCLTQE